MQTPVSFRKPFLHKPSREPSFYYGFLKVHGKRDVKQLTTIYSMKPSMLAHYTGSEARGRLLPSRLTTCIPLSHPGTGTRNSGIWTRGSEGHYGTWLRILVFAVRTWWLWEFMWGSEDQPKPVERLEKRVLKRREDEIRRHDTLKNFHVITLVHHNVRDPNVPHSRIHRAQSLCFSIGLMTFSIGRHVLHGGPYLILTGRAYTE